MRPKPWPRARAGTTRSAIFQVGHLVPPEVPQGEQDAEGQPALEHAARPGHPDELLGVLEVVPGVAHEQDELGPDQGHDHDVEGRVQEAGGVQALLLGLAVDEPQAEGHTQGHHETIGMDGQRTELEQDGIHADCLLEKTARMSRTAPMLMQASATL